MALKELPPPLCPSECIEVGVCLCHDRPDVREKRLNDFRSKPYVGECPAPAGIEGLRIEGIATTRGWGFKEPARYYPGLDPRRFRPELPLPLWWNHDPTKPIGKMIGYKATDDAVHFTAVVFPPDMIGCDAQLLRETWDGIRNGTVLGVSLDADYEAGGHRTIGARELSVCPKGANPAAVITRAVFPDGEFFQRAEPMISLERTKAVSAAFYRQHDEEFVRRRWGTGRAEDTGSLGALRTELAAVHKQLDELRFLRDLIPEGPNPQAPMRYKGVWHEGQAYRAGDVCTHRGLIWHANEETMARPGSGSAFTMMLKSEEHR